MLRNLSITNFKSFNGRTDIPLSSINVFAGANSSGKSTIIQSLLLIKQTLEHSPKDRSIALNGPILKLGSFEDVRNADSDKPILGLGWALDVKRPEMSIPRRYHSSNTFFPHFYYDPRSKLTSLNADLRFELEPRDQESQHSAGGGADERRLLQPRLARAELFLERNQNDNTVRREYVKVAPKKSSDSKSGQEGILPSRPSTTEYDVVEIDQHTRTDLTEEKSSAKIVGAKTEHFFPTFFEVSYDEGQNTARIITDFLCSDRLISSRVEREYQSTLIPANVVKLISDHISLLLAPNQFSFNLDETAEAQLGALAERIRAARHRTRSFPRPRIQVSETQTSLVPTSLNLDELRPQIQAALNSHFGTHMETEVELASNIFEATQFANWYFSNAVHYLGPLRDEPKPIYPLEGLADLAEVGYRGEHTAAVLDLYQDVSIDYVPSRFVEKLSPTPEKVTASLHDAVVDWLSYLGVADDVSTQDRGKIGHTLGVKSGKKSRLHDLTNVGVGVSQVLPIVVMSLLAEQPCSLIFEQPELHLHPRVQARLADFFLSMALSGKQCLLETHSEYLIERFRRRIAESEGDSLTHLLNIYFTERSSGQTVCRKIEVTKFGAIQDWPKDFFDQSQIETEGILRAGLTKKKLESGRKSK